MVIKQLSNLDRENEIIISFNKRIWTVEVNGLDVTNSFKPPLGHNGNWKKVKKIRGKSKNMIRRLTATINQKIPEWAKLSHDQCGRHYQLNQEQLSHLGTTFPSLLSSMNVGKSTMIEKCQAKNNNVSLGEHRIVGGQAAQPGYYPWLVALRLSGSPNPHQCGASLINRCWAITAAHCFPKGNSFENKYTARVGDYHNKATDYDKWQPLESVHESKLKQVIIHRKYNARNAENDLALIELVDCVPSFNQFRAPICLPTATKQHDAGECCHIQGWGKTASDAGQLKEFVQLDRQMAASNSSYERIYSDENPPKLFPTEMQMATNYIETDETCSSFYPKTYK